MVYTNTVFKIDFPSLMPLFGKRFEKILTREKNEHILETAEKDFLKNVKPAVFWQRMRIDYFNEDSVTLENGMSIGGGPVTHVIDAAEELIVGICTIGREPERISREALKSGNSVYGMVMDFLGSWGVDRLKDDFYTHMRSILEESEGFRCSTLLSPGESDWDIGEQGNIFELVREEAVAGGTQLTESNMLVPMKSLSFLFGIGKNRMGHEHTESCAFCTMREKCVYRKFRKH